MSIDTCMTKEQLVATCYRLERSCCDLQELHRDLEIENHKLAAHQRKLKKAIKRRARMKEGGFLSAILQELNLVPNFRPASDPSNKSDSSKGGASRSSALSPCSESPGVSAVLVSRTSPLSSEKGDIMSSLDSPVGTSVNVDPFESEAVLKSSTGWGTRQAVAVNRLLDTYRTGDGETQDVRDRETGDRDLLWQVRHLLEADMNEGVEDDSSGDGSDEAASQLDKFRGGSARGRPPIGSQPRTGSASSKESGMATLQVETGKVVGRLLDRSLSRGASPKMKGGKAKTPPVTNGKPQPAVWDKPKVGCLSEPLSDAELAELQVMEALGLAVPKQLQLRRDRTPKKVDADVISPTDEASTGSDAAACKNDRALVAGREDAMKEALRSGPASKSMSVGAAEQQSIEATKLASADSQKAEVHVTPERIQTSPVGRSDLFSAPGRMKSLPIASAYAELTSKLNNPGPTPVLTDWQKRSEQLMKDRAIVAAEAARVREEAKKAAAEKKEKEVKDVECSKREDEMRASTLSTASSAALNPQDVVKKSEGSCEVLNAVEDFMAVQETGANGTNVTLSWWGEEVDQMSVEESMGCKIAFMEGRKFEVHQRIFKRDSGKGPRLRTHTTNNEEIQVVVPAESIMSFQVQVVVTVQGCHDDNKSETSVVKSPLSAIVWVPPNGASLVKSNLSNEKPCNSLEPACTVEPSLRATPQSPAKTNDYKTYIINETLQNESPYNVAKEVSEKPSPKKDAKPPTTNKLAASRLGGGFSFAAGLSKALESDKKGLEGKAGMDLDKLVFRDNKSESANESKSTSEVNDDKDKLGEALQVTRGMDSKQPSDVGSKSIVEETIFTENEEHSPKKEQKSWVEDKAKLSRKTRKSVEHKVVDRYQLTPPKNLPPRRIEKKVESKAVDEKIEKRKPTKPAETKLPEKKGEKEKPSALGEKEKNRLANDKLNKWMGLIDQQVVSGAENVTERVEKKVERKVGGKGKEISRKQSGRSKAIVEENKSRLQSSMQKKYGDWSNNLTETQRSLNASIGVSAASVSKRAKNVAHPKAKTGKVEGASLPSKQPTTQATRKEEKVTEVPQRLDDEDQSLSLSKKQLSDTQDSIHHDSR
eukprot:Platyproteum_vivax@DN7386_c0_g1_i2.p1